MDDGFEQFSRLRWMLKRVMTDPAANYLPAGWLRGLLRFGKSELAQANWSDPGGWRSMVISYEGRPARLADRILINAGAVSMALRNRLRLASRLLTELIDRSPPPVRVLCLGAGPGQVVLQAMRRARVLSRATLVDVNPDGFDFGRRLAERHGLGERVTFVRGDARNVRGYLADPPAVVKMIGICEYLSDEQIVDIARAAGDVMEPGSAILFNNITRRHGNDRFLRRVFGLHMTYRTVEHLAGLMGQAGFADFQAHHEPLGVYSVIVGRRAAVATATAAGAVGAASVPSGPAGEGTLGHG